MKNNLEILYEDNHIIVVIKPVNILSQADNTGDIDMLTMVKDYIKVKYNKPGNVYLGLVHRLDRPTGGIMVFAKTNKASERLSKQIRDGKFDKRYYAVIDGVLKKDEDTFYDKILKTKDNSSIISEDGKDAKLSYKLLEVKNKLSLVDVNLYTGRHHQIRVQFASRGFSLYGDQRYGRENKKQLALFAHYLSFYHPVSKEKLEFNTVPLYGIFKDFFGGLYEKRS